MLISKYKSSLPLKFKIKIIDNFLKKNDLKEIIKLPINKIIKYGFRNVWGTIDKNGNIQGKINHKIIKLLHNNYHFKAIKILKKLNKFKLPLYEFSEFTLIVTNKNSKSHIHDDIPNKLLSGVVYLSPKKNCGTFFYNNKNSTKNSIEVSWKVNRAVFFSRKEGQTWHSYQGDGVNNRLVLVYNLMTKNVAEVYKLEKKFFLIYYTINFFRDYFYKLKILIKIILKT